MSHLELADHQNAQWHRNAHALSAPQEAPSNLDNSMVLRKEASQASQAIRFFFFGGGVLGLYLFFFGFVFRIFLGFFKVFWWFSGIFFMVSIVFLFYLFFF